MSEQEGRISESRFATAARPHISKQAPGLKRLEFVVSFVKQDIARSGLCIRLVPFIHQHKILRRVCQAMLLISSPIPFLIRLSFVITAVSISWDRALKRKRGGGGVRLE